MNTIKEYFVASSKDDIENNNESNKRSLSDGSSASTTELHAAKKCILDADPDTSLNLSGELKLQEIEFEADSPHWLPLLFKSMAAIQGQIAELAHKVDDLSTFKADVNKKLGDYERSLKFVSDKYEEQKTEIVDLKERVKNLEDDNAKTKNDFGLLARRVDKNEQHSRNECLVLHGVAEAATGNGNGGRKEACEQLFAAAVSAEVGVELHKEELKRAHRLGAPRADGKPRAIIARFWSMHKRNDVYFHKKNLKGKRLLITENLTDVRLEAFKAARAKHGDKSVWSNEGRIYAKNKDGNKVTIFV